MASRCTYNVCDWLGGRLLKIDEGNACACFLFRKTNVSRTFVEANVFLALAAGEELKARGKACLLYCREQRGSDTAPLKRRIDDQFSDAGCAVFAIYADGAYDCAVFLRLEDDAALKLRF